MSHKVALDGILCDIPLGQPLFRGCSFAFAGKSPANTKIMERCQLGYRGFA